tara:strand:+ start:939 stop:1232 length:294 start_codon:yes stop_codon:yes gene_type:complete
MNRIIILPLAREDIREAAKWYNSKRAGLGKRFTSQVRTKISFIKTHPEAFAVRHGSTRTTLLKTFPFLIHYSIIEDSNVIIISAVLHTSRNPKIWKR